jgi:hypothetical protein
MTQVIAFQTEMICSGFERPAIDALNANGVNTTQDLLGIKDEDTE